MLYNLITNVQGGCVTAPDMIYYSHIPTAIVSLFFGFFIISRNRSLTSILFFIISFSIFIWTLFSLITWTSNNSAIITAVWSFFPMLEIIIFTSSFYFAYAYINKNKASVFLNILYAMIVSIFLGLTYTNINIPIFNIDSCESIEGSIFKLGYLVEMFIAIVLLSYIIYKYIKERDIYFKKQILLIGAGILFFLLSFSWTNVFGSITLDWKMTQYGLFGMPVFIGILAYMIVKFKAFNIKLIGTQALIVAQVILIASMFAFVRTTTNQVLTGITLFLTAVMGWNLIRSVKKEVALREALEISSAELVERKDELQMMADRLAQSNDQLRTLDNAKSEFISIASHQLRTPLTAIKGFLSLLLEGSYGPVGEKHVEVLNKIYISNERLITLVEDLLNISRIESGRMEFKFDQWDLEKICGEVLDTFALRAKDNDLYLEYTPPETPVPEVTIDGVKVREVISNLVDNALKYTLHGHGGVTLRLQQVGDAARITVADTGIGVPATELPYLFAKFSRGKDISRLNTGGTGLGLYVGRNMIESNGGKIWAESDGQDHGSRFIIEIPLVQSPELLAKWE